MQSFPKNAWDFKGSSDVCSWDGPKFPWKFVGNVWMLKKNLRIFRTDGCRVFRFEVAVGVILRSHGQSERFHGWQTSDDFLLTASRAQSKKEKHVQIIFVGLGLRPCVFKLVSANPVRNIRRSQAFLKGLTSTKGWQQAGLQILKKCFFFPQNAPYIGMSA